ncbi:hypothetical protein [Halogranum rubrum]|nr:hypothetical protein [Halogranum rubrum]
MVRYETVVDDGQLSLVHEDERIEVGSMAAVADLVGGETYTLTYTDAQASTAWLQTDDDNELTIDVPDAVERLTHTSEFATLVRDCPLDETGESGHPRRTELFATLLMKIWDSKGNLDSLSDG